MASEPLRDQANGGWSCPFLQDRICIWGESWPLGAGRAFSAAWLDAIKEKGSNLLLI